MDRLNRVRIATNRRTVEIGWNCREEILDELRRLDAGPPVVADFTAVGATRPVELDTNGKALVLSVIHMIGRETGGLHHLPAGLRELRNALLDDRSNPTTADSRGSHASANSRSASGSDRFRSPRVTLVPPVASR
jgi:hypothetical protein